MRGSSFQAKSGIILLRVHVLITCEHALSCGSLDKTNILHYTRLFIWKVIDKRMFGQGLWVMDSWFPYRGVETLPSTSCKFEGRKSLEEKKHL